MSTLPSGDTQLVGTQWQVDIPGWMDHLAPGSLVVGHTADGRAMITRLVPAPPAPPEAPPEPPIVPPAPPAPPEAPPEPPIVPPAPPAPPEAPIVPPAPPAPPTPPAPPELPRTSGRSMLPFLLLAAGFATFVAGLRARRPARMPQEARKHDR
ncbi:MAG: hypothetical protein KGZ44_00665 [Dethiobacter sp.]|nr:hypothetical protein [Dethiobacter sp.]